MATAVGDRFVRRHNAARSSTANTTAAVIDYDTAVISEGGYSWASSAVTVDTDGWYKVVFDLGWVELAGSSRAVGTLVPRIDGVAENTYRATHRYLRNSGGSFHGAAFGICYLYLTSGEAVDIYNPGVLTPTDAAGNYATTAGLGGAIQVTYMGTGNMTLVRRTTDAAEVGTSNINTTRPWIDSSGTWTKITYNSEDYDDDGLYSGSGGDLTLKADKKYDIVWGATIYSTDSSRHTNVVRAVVDSVNFQTASGYHRNSGTQGPPMCGGFFYEVGGTNETLYLDATHETEGGDAGTPEVADAYLFAYELPDDAEWIHVDNGATDSMTTALAGTSTWYTMPLSSTFRADGNSDMSLDAANDGIQNDSGDTLRLMTYAWQRWDRDSGSSGTRKAPYSRFAVNGTGLTYGYNSAFSRGQQSSDDNFQAHIAWCALADLPNGQDLTAETRCPANGNNSDMGIYASTSRHFLGMQALNLDTLVAAAGPDHVVPRRKLTTVRM